MTDSTNSITLPSTSQHDFEDVEKPMEIESICPNCHENGITKIISINIPFYRQVIVMSFACEHCGLQNNNLQSGEQAQVSNLFTYFSCLIACQSLGGSHSKSFSSDPRSVLEC